MVLPFACSSWFYVGFQNATLISILRSVTAERVRADVTVKLSVIAPSYLRLFRRSLLRRRQRGISESTRSTREISGFRISNKPARGYRKPRRGYRKLLAAKAPLEPLRDLWVISSSAETPAAFVWRLADTASATRAQRLALLALAQRIFLYPPPSPSCPPTCRRRNCGGRATRLLLERRTTGAETPRALRVLTRALPRCWTA